MSRRRIRFVKNLFDDTGHQQKCLEGGVKIRQPKNEDRDGRAAPHRFARTNRIQHQNMRDSIRPIRRA